MPVIYPSRPEDLAALARKVLSVAGERRAHQVALHTASSRQGFSMPAEIAQELRQQLASPPRTSTAAAARPAADKPQRATKKSASPRRAPRRTKE